MNRVIVPFVVLALGGCIDTSLPDLSLELGEGRTDGPICGPETLEAFPPEQLRITLIDVGQGDGIWIQTPYFENQQLESLNIIVDAGPSGNVPGTSPGGAAMVDHLLTYGLPPGERIDALVITHAHEDHYGGVSAIVSMFEVERYVDPGFSANSSGFLAARSTAESDVAKNGGQSLVPAIPSLVTRPFVQTDLFGQYVEADVLWSAEAPPSGNVNDPTGTDVNNTSIAFALRWGGKQALLLADLESEVEQELVDADLAGEIDLTSAVLKVAHHGSSSSTSPTFISLVFPAASPNDWAVISSGRRSFGGTTLPTDETLGNLQFVLDDHHLLSTDNRDDIKEPGTEHGDDTIIVTMDADGTVQACYVP